MELHLTSKKTKKACQEFSLGMEKTIFKDRHEFSGLLLKQMNMSIII
jgi:deoxyadenosine/deoxycytidine kinase